MNKIYYTENKLNKLLIKGRIILVLLAIISLAIGIACSILFETTKEVIPHINEFFSWEEVNYNYDYIYGIVFGFFGAFLFAIFFIVHLLFCKYRSITKGESVITIYRGFFQYIAYVNGKEVDRLFLNIFKYVMEFRLNDGVRVTISFPRNCFGFAHLSFSDNSPSMTI